MAWILAIGGQGNALILTVATDSGLAGQTVTCSDGITTLTKTFPSASPFSVEFKIPNAGTWTVTSGTLSETVIIPDLVELHDTPTGSTAIPTDDIQTWLHCANIWDTSYTTISEVLNDASTLQALIASNNASDYLVRSTTWANSICADSSAMSYIGLNDYCANLLLANSTWSTAICNSAYFESVLTTKVPTMTSNTTPSGVASSGYLDTPYLAFDKNNNTSAHCTTENVNPYLNYEFPNEMLIRKASITAYSVSKNFSIKLQQKVNGSFVDLQSFTVTTSSQTFSFNFNTSNKSNSFRLYSSSQKGAGNNLYFIEVQYYGRS